MPRTSNGAALRNRSGAPPRRWCRRSRSTTFGTPHSSSFDTRRLPPGSMRVTAQGRCGASACTVMGGAVGLGSIFFFFWLLFLLWLRLEGESSGGHATKGLVYQTRPPQKARGAALNRHAGSGNRPPAGLRTPGPASASASSATGVDRPSELAMSRPTVSAGRRTALQAILGFDKLVA